MPSIPGLPGLFFPLSSLNNFFSYENIVQKHMYAGLVNEVKSFPFYF